MQRLGVETARRSVHDWGTTDDCEINRRRRRAETESFDFIDSDAIPPASHKPEPVDNPLLTDRLLCFAKAVHEQVDATLVRCEEHYPLEAPHSVLYFVVERDAAQWRERLDSLQNDYLGAGRRDPLAPVQLEVVDRATHEAVKRLVSAGLVTRTSRVMRSLWPVDESASLPPPLSEAEQERAASYRSQAARKLKMAGVLAGGDLAEEARLAVLDAIEPLGRALAVENRLPEPQSLEDALLPPMCAAWKGALPLVRNLLRESSEPVAPIVSALAQI